MRQKLLGIIVASAMATSLSLSSCVDREDPAMPVGWVPPVQNNGNGGNGGQDPDNGNSPDQPLPTMAKVKVNGSERYYYPTQKIMLSASLSAMAPGFIISGYSVNGQSMKLGEIVEASNGVTINAIAQPTVQASVSDAAKILANAKSKDIVNLEVTDLSDGNVASLKDAISKSAASVNLVIAERENAVQMLKLDGCANLLSVALPSNTNILFANAFKGCSRLQSVAFGGSSREVSGMPGPSATPAAIDEEKLKTAASDLYERLKVDAAEYSLIRMNPYDNIYTLAGQYFHLSEADGTYSLNEVFFGDGVFWKDSDLKNPLKNGVILAQTVISHPTTDKMTILANAFYGCERLSYLILPQNITDLASEAFANCKNLKFVSIENRSIKIEANTFEGIAEKPTFQVPDDMGESVLNIIKGIGGTTIKMYQ